MDCKSIFGCVPGLGLGIGGHRIYKEYISAKDKRVKNVGTSIFSQMNKTEIVHGICEFVPLAGPFLYGSGKLICFIARKVDELWMYIKQNWRSGHRESIAQPIHVFVQPIVPAIDLSNVKGLNQNELLQLSGKRIMLRATDAAIDRPCHSMNDEERMREIKNSNSKPQEESESIEAYNKRIMGYIHRENAARARGIASLPVTPFTKVYTGTLLNVGEANRKTKRYEVKILFESIDGFKPWNETRDPQNLPYGMELDKTPKTLSFYLSDEELQKFNPPPYPLED